MSAVVLGRSRGVRLCSTLVAALLVLVACAGGPGAAGTGKSRTLVMAIGADPTGWSPAVSLANQFNGCIVYEGLVSVGAKGEPLPALARSWTVSPDGLTYTFQLQKTQWTDGKPFTSADVKYTIENVTSKLSSLFARAAKVITSVEAPADDQVVLHLSAPYSPMLASLSCGVGGEVLPKHLLENAGDIKQNPIVTSKPVGTGPFMMQSYERGNQITFVRNPHYWDPGKPYIDTLIAKIIPDPSTAVAALQRHEINYIFFAYFRSSSYAAIEADKSLKLVEFRAGGSDDLLMFNTKRTPFENATVRQALFRGIDRDYIGKAVFHDRGQVGISSIEPVLANAYDPAVDYRTMYPFDAAKAGQLLDQAGYPVKDGKRFSAKILVNAAQADYVSYAQVVVQQWKAIGVDATLSVVPAAAFPGEAFQKLDFDVLVQGYGTYQNPILGVARQFVSSSIGQSFGNASQYSNPEVDQLFQQAQQAIDDTAARPAYARIQQIIARDLPSFPVYQPGFFDAASASLTGLWDGTFFPTWPSAKLADG
ncbi:ABC transporter substrate-binding protein [Pseudonocardia sp. GCM10023141]|uniref:ABC transporter substrate-binding protein n=1 Tax=Pseudonocardia sp. GCM10023141 TaxID=3252653 RepID=UPI0036180F36